MIYIDIIKKAISSIPNVSVNSPSQNRSARQYDSSYEKDPIGVVGGSLSPDSPSVGAKWRGKDPTTKEEEEAENEESDEAIREENELEAAKSLLKSVMHNVDLERRRYTLNPAEKQFLVEVLGYESDDLHKGSVVLSPTHRVEFNRWLCQRFRNSVGNLIK